MISRETGCPLREEATNHFEAQSAQDSLVEASGELRTLAVSLMKIANDIRWLGSGPRCGLERSISRNSTRVLDHARKGQPGHCRVGHHGVCAGDGGNDVTVTVGGQAGNFELIVMLPVMAYNLLQSIECSQPPRTISRPSALRGLRRTKSAARVSSKRVSPCARRWLQKSVMKPLPSWPRKRTGLEDGAAGGQGRRSAAGKTP